MVFDIYTYGGGEAVYEAFNAVAALMGGGDYIVLVKIFMVLALFWVAIEMGFHQTINWQLFIMFGLMFNIFFVPKETIVVHDVYNPSATRVVANVPFGLAGPAWLANTVGHHLTQMTEAAYSQPNDLEYSSTGMAFGSRLMTSIDNARFDDPLLNQNLTMYAKQCIFMNIAYHFYSVKDIYTSNDLIGLLLSTNRNSDLRGMFYDNGGTTLYLTCRQAASRLRTDITPVVDNMILHFANMFFRSTGQSPAANKTHLLAALPAAYGFMANISTSAQTMLGQAAMANYFENSYGDVAAMMGSAAASTAWATAVAERQQRSAYRTSGNIAAKFLPIFQSAFRVIIYSSFIVIFLALMMPVTIAGKALKTFVQMLLWIEYWPIVYAFINMVVNLYAKGVTIYSQDATLGITSMAGLYGMSQVNADIGIVAGYLALSVPVIAWGMASGSAFALTGIASGLFAPASQASNQVGGEIARGNISAGNMSAGNQSIMQGQSAPHMVTGGEFTDANGTLTTGDNDVLRYNQNVSSFAVKPQTASQVTNSVDNRLNHAHTIAATERNSVANSTSNQSTQLANFTQSAGHNQQVMDSAKSHHLIGDTGSFTGSKDFATTHGHDHNVSGATMQRVYESVNAGIDLSTDQQALGKIAALATGVSAHGGVQAGQEGNATGKIEDAYNAAVKSGEAQQYANIVKEENAYATDITSNNGYGAGTEATKGVTDAHTQLSQTQHGYEASKSSELSLQKASDTLHSQSAQVNIDNSNLLGRESIKHGIALDDTASQAKLVHTVDFRAKQLEEADIPNADFNGDGKIESWKQELSKASLSIPRPIGQ